MHECIQNSSFVLRATSNNNNILCLPLNDTKQWCSEFYDLQTVKTVMGFSKDWYSVAHCKVQLTVTDPPSCL